MYFRRHWREVVAIVMLLIVNVILIILGAKSNNKFWDYNIMSLLTFDVAVSISFYLVQKIGSYHRKIDFIVNSVSAIEDMLMQSRIRDVSSEDAIRSARLLQRTIANRLEQIKKHAPKSIEEVINKACDTFNEYKELFDDNSMNQENITKKKIEFERLESVLSDIFFDIKMELYDEGVL